MTLNHSACFLLLISISAFTNAEIIEGRLGFSGMVTEATCALTVGEEVTMLSSPSGKQAASVKIALKQCPDNFINVAKMSLNDVSDNPPFADFIHQSGDKIVKGNIVEPFRFARINPGEFSLPLIISKPVTDISSGYTGLLHLSYD